MRPTILLGESRNDPPEIEFDRSEIHPIAACVLHLFSEQFETSDDLLGELSAITHGDVMWLDAESAPLFRMFEEACERIVVGEITQYDSALIKEFYVTRNFQILEYGEHGRLEPTVVTAAQKFLEFLGANPDYWPPRFGIT